VSVDAFSSRTYQQPSLISSEAKMFELATLTAVSPLTPLHSAAKDHRAPLAARRRDRRPRTAPLRSALFQATDDLAGAPQCEGNCVLKDFSLRHSLISPTLDRLQKKNPEQSILGAYSSLSFEALLSRRLGGVGGQG
jgi:hypothetical protein